MTDNLTDLILLRQQITEKREMAGRLYCEAAEDEERLMKLINPLSDPQIATEVAAKVCAAVHVKISDLFSCSRIQQVATARGIVIYIIRTRYKWSFSRIGRTVDRDHSSVMHLHGLICTRIQQSAAFGSMVHKLLDCLEPPLEPLLGEIDAEPNHDSRRGCPIPTSTPIDHLPAAQTQTIAGL